MGQGIGQGGEISTASPDGEQQGSIKTKKGTDQTGQQTGLPPQKGYDRDDDIVARQLREAAEKESDPELKEKLWEEYRKYKENM